MDRQTSFFHEVACLRWYEADGVSLSKADVIQNGACEEGVMVRVAFVASKLRRCVIIGSALEKKQKFI
ncbi:hypothetical protein [Streptococcus thoraltensis]|uniref:hypothetical protein n=1 Tax=Streptococcus thoraltensis TaxID=55085 RepID=UPI000360D06B|nr:hypothetical protein [Streptococcus thoraltensis]MDY4760481.1 hypothetical protein [Streptococcus thoraltensis]